MKDSEHHKITEEALLLISSHYYKIFYEKKRTIKEQLWKMGSDHWLTMTAKRSKVSQNSQKINITKFVQDQEFKNIFC